MVNLIRELQNLADQLAPQVLWVGGGLVVWLGLCLWLGGLRWLKFYAGIAAAAIGYAAAYVWTNRELYFLVGIPVAAGLLAICFEKTTVVLLTGVLIGAVVSLALVWPTLNDPATWQNPPAATPPAAGQEVTVAQSLTVLENYAVWIRQNIYNAARTLGSVNWVVYGVVILAIAGLGLLVPRGICALACAIYGSVTMAIGMFFLLLYKGSRPADLVLANPSLFGMIAAGMVVFGVLINLAVAPPKSRKKAVQQAVAEKG
jgi:hypothetical protein